MKKVINKDFLSTIISGVSFIDVDGAEDVFRDVDYNDELEIRKSYSLPFICRLLLL